MANLSDKKKGFKAFLDDDLIKRREEHHTKKLESHRKLQKWLKKHRYRAKINEVRELTTWADRVVSIGVGIVTATLSIVHAGPPLDDGIGDLIWAYSLVALIALLFFSVPAWLMLMAFAHYRK